MIPYILPCKKTDFGKKIKTEVRNFMFKVNLCKEAQATTTYTASGVGEYY